MADRGDTHYHVPNLNLWFLLSSGLFLLTMVWTVIDDATTEWKGYQKEFRRLEYDLADADRQAFVDDGTIARRDGLQEEVDAAQARVDSERAEPGGLDELTEAYLDAKEQFRQIEGRFKADEAERKWAIWEFERDKVYADDPEVIADLQAQIDALWTVNQEKANEVEAAAAARNAAEQAMKAAEAVVTEAEKALAIATADLRMIELRMEKLRPSDVPTKLANVIRDAPGLDFIGPNLQVKKQIPPGVTLDLNFTKKPVIDMCTSCHMGADRAGFDGIDPATGEPIPHPYRSHPNLDLYLSSNSPHPVKAFGCTVCHRGSGESLSFQHADHRPDELNPDYVLDQHAEDHDLFQDADAVRWHDDETLGWHGKQHHWDYPMLTTQHTEASCVQCHKTSMELIADDAPMLSEGYRLVERNGCYACHKIDWFPTKRRPGPSLLQMRGKLTRDFVEAWVAKPREFRPTTSMPHVFHLENYGANEVIAVANYGEVDEDGEPVREIKGKEWNDNAVAAVARYLFENHAETQFPPVPLPGNAERGREVMNVSGCYACHNTAPYPGEEGNGLGNPSDELGRYNDQGPNLRGVATKINAEWLFAWIKDPSAYWHDTNMPNLRLPDQDIADIVAYMTEDPDGIFTDVPDDWDVAARVVDLDVDVLREQARWYLAKDGRHALEEKFAGEWSDSEALAVAVGKAFVTNQGCFSCHEIDGMQDGMPIGAELSNWSSKTVDKLDFGLSYRKKLKLPRNVIAQAVHQKGDENGELTELDHHYREGWLARKLAHPRSFDIDKVKNPKEKLRMPWFDFTDEEIDAISTFVLGLVNDDVPGAKMQPTAEQLAMDSGHRALRQKNCASCHVLEPGRVTFRDEDGHEHTVSAELGAFAAASMPLPMTSLDHVLAERAGRTAFLLDDPDLDDEDRADLAQELEAEEAIIRLWEPNADVGEPFKTVLVPFDRIVSVTPPEGGDYVRHQTKYYRGGVQVPNPEHDPNDPGSFPTDPWTYHADYDEWTFPVADYVDGEPRDYEGEEYDAVRWTFAPPVLVNEGHKVQREWFFAFLKDPVRLRKQMRAKMPTFNYEDGEAEAIADYFVGKAREDWFPRYARTLRLTLGREAREGLEDGSVQNAWRFPEDTHAWPTTVHTTTGLGLSIEEVAQGSGLMPRQIANIERGYKPEIAGNFDKLFQWGESQGFRMTGRVPEGYERIVRQSRTHLLDYADRIPIGEAVAVAPEGSVNCYQCHPNPEGTFAQDPIAWAPPLENVRERLREEWVREWLWSPKLIYPGTKMADNFAGDAPGYQVHYPDSTNPMQIDAVMDWLYNMEGGAAVEAVGSSFDPNDLTDEQLLAMLQNRGQLTDAELAQDDPPVEDPPVEDPPMDDPPVEDPPVDDPPADDPPADDPPPVVASGPGVVTGRVIFDGTPPTQKTVSIKPEQAKSCCGSGSTDTSCIDSRDRTEAVATNGGIEYCVVTIEVDGATAPAATEPYVLDQHSCRYEPHVLVVPVGAKVKFKNSDETAHNVHTYASKNDSMNKGAGAGESLEQTFERAETIKVGCDLHPWMGAQLVVTEATHWAVTDKNGNFSIEGLPPGEHRVEIWHETFAERPEKAKVVVPENGEAEAIEVKLGKSSGGGRRR